MFRGIGQRILATLKLPSVSGPLFWGTLSLLSFLTWAPSSFFLLAGAGLIGFGGIQGIRRFFAGGVRRAFSARDNAIDELMRRCRRSRDRRTKVDIRRLDEVLQRMHKLRDVDDDVMPLGEKLHQLWDRCYEAADGLVKLRVAEGQLATSEARRSAQQHSAEFRDLLERGLDQLERAVDRLHLAAATGGYRGDELRDLSDELDRNLQIARRVEERMSDFDELPERRAYE